MSWKTLGLIILIGLLMVGAAAAGFWYARQNPGELAFPTPLIGDQLSAKPLQAYSIPNLISRDYQTSPITIEQTLAEEDTYTSYIFSYRTLNDQKVTGQLNVPHPAPTRANVIVLLRGYVPLEIFESGVGTKNAARVLAEHGYVTVAPDFLGYGGSDPEPENDWQARFEKPIIVIELMKSLAAEPLAIPASQSPTGSAQTITLANLGLWGHSNGGQIALSVLEILGQPIPTTLWAPVTAPFPYSILFFSDESEDEGKEMRQWLSQFEADYDVFDFTITQHLNRLRGPLQLHHGTADEAALKLWSDEFVDKLARENQRRVKELDAQATISATAADDPFLQPIEYTYLTYPGADHNLQPGWDTVVQRDLEFFAQHLPTP